jgi:ferric-dicitrate binding protein FerR (iron transport regulator)
MVKIPRNQDPDGGRPLAEEAMVERLIRVAGKRRPVPPERAMRVRATVHAEWRRAIRTDRRHRATSRLAWSIAAAATIIVGLTLGAWRFGVGPWVPVLPAASVERVVASVRLVDGERAFLETGEALLPGSLLETGADGRLAIRLASGHSVRLDTDTRLRLRSGSALDLDRGAVYVDSGVPDGGQKSIAIRTPLGVARDIGTQFEVRFRDESMLVRVREGDVELDHAGRAETASAGTELQLDASGELSRRAVPLHGTEWDWAVRIAPAFDLEGQSLAEFLGWASRETGMTVVYLDASTAQEARDIELRGSVEGLTPEEALAAVLPTCGLEHEIEEGTVILKPRLADGGERR